VKLSPTNREDAKGAKGSRGRTMKESRQIDMKSFAFASRVGAFAVKVQPAIQRNPEEREDPAYKAYRKRIYTTLATD